MQALLLILILVPAPKVEQVEPTPSIVGSWAIDWGSCPFRQTTIFHADGTCHSPECGNGLWWIDEFKQIWFQEYTSNQYVMVADLRNGVGMVRWVSSTGELGTWTQLKLRRGEHLKVMPRESKG